jgi:RNA polymerase sigma-70 factor (ECF subfamily)
MTTCFELLSLAWQARFEGKLETMSAELEMAMEQLAHRYGTALRRFFERRLKTSRDPEDLTQEVFVRLIRQRHTEDIRHLDGYVFQTAANVLRDHLRRWSIRQGEVHHAQLEEEPIEGGFSPERIALGQEAVMRLIMALHELPATTQAVFARYHFEGIPQVEIARQFNLSTSTVERHMSRANAHILARLRDSD